MSLSNSFTTTILISVTSLLLGLPIAITAIALEQVYIPEVILGTKEINAGPKGPKTITFSLLSSSDDAVLASSYIFLASSLLCAIGFVLLRHVRKFSKTFGWTLIGTTVANVLAQVACILAWIILQGKRDAKTAEEGAITYNDGKYDAAGRLFSREAWACSMNELFTERESAWADKACENLKGARYITIVTTMFAFALLGMAYWQVLSQGGIAWLMGKAPHKGQVKELSDVESFELRQ